MERKLYVKPGPLWGAGVATAAIAALAAVVVYWLATGVAGVDLFVSESPGSDDLRELTVGPVLFVPFILTVVATGVLHLMLLFVPRPVSFFVALGLLFTLASLLPVFGLDVSTEQTLWLVALHLTVGVVTVTSLAGIVPYVTEWRFTQSGGGGRQQAAT
jgi:hypothetical protein